MGIVNGRKDNKKTRIFASYYHVNTMNHGIIRSNLEASCSPRAGISSHNYSGSGVDRVTDSDTAPQGTKSDLTDIPHPWKWVRCHRGGRDAVTVWANPKMGI